MVAAVDLWWWWLWTYGGGGGCGPVVVVVVDPWWWLWTCGDVKLLNGPPSTYYKISTSLL
ncbi:hypothetical protein OSB04_007381 [Centaurea solstitialis]|uniref:Uncharacterized protein n=1 Tax=Centaurea solstitialis TaxID=347529 RepID=A0AA38WT86_9ASTR|nr:hypothetical protein OSB04_007381 [Centaurea solstitialis]